MSRIKESVVLAIAVLGLGAFLYCAMMHTKDRDRVVSVKGLSEREVKADYVIWPIVFKEVRNDLVALYESVQNKTATLEKFLLDNGVAAEEISKASPDITDTESEIYASEKRSQRYVATVVMTVASKDVEKLRGIMGKQGELLKQGIAFSEGDYRYRKVYSFNGLNDVKPEMIDEANKNARAAAQKFATDSESKLGKIKTASQGLFSIEDRDENTPYIKKVRVVTNVQYFLED
ncbi:SIMPL domain-containing protein [Fibrobacter sp. UBA4309]|uniref:SIMPL domain-containing protein n=1 Tax=Fibrobacter sp. UBA4309 TaxID=1946537 RepID=UPI0025BF075A|nr:SIMPL domain-containing protein [Fibrobacter sp. UBA4309]